MCRAKDERWTVRRQLALTSEAGPLFHVVRVSHFDACLSLFRFFFFPASSAAASAIGGAATSSRGVSSSRSAGPASSSPASPSRTRAVRRCVTCTACLLGAATANSCAANDGSSATKLTRPPVGRRALASSPNAFGALRSFSLAPVILDKSNWRRRGTRTRNVQGEILRSEVTRNRHTHARQTHGRTSEGSWTSHTADAERSSVAVSAVVTASCPSGTGAIFTGTCGSNYRDMLQDFASRAGCSECESASGCTRQHHSLASRAFCS